MQKYAYPLEGLSLEFAKHVFPFFYKKAVYKKPIKITILDWVDPKERSHFESPEKRFDVYIDETSENPTHTINILIYCLYIVVM